MVTAFAYPEIVHGPDPPPRLAAPQAVVWLPRESDHVPAQPDSRKPLYTPPGHSPIWRAVLPACPPPDASDQLGEPGIVRAGRCGKTLREPIPFGPGKGRCTKVLETYGIELCQFAPIKNVACLVAPGWDTAKAICTRQLERKVTKRRFSGVGYIAVDEFAIRRGLLLHFQHRIATGPLEWMNNKIKVLERQA